MTGAYYNENDPQKAAWIRELIRQKVVCDGEVDERSIKEVTARDLEKFTQCHFFAGIGVWSYSLRLAGWPDDRPVWTGSCPCPSFSAAGKGRGFNDPRHLWPDWARLACECRPATIFGEQVDDAIGYGWLDLVQTDLERENYAVGKAVLGACSVGAPHIRKRLYFVGSLEHSACERQPFGAGQESGKFQGKALPEELRSSHAGRMEHAKHGTRTARGPRIQFQSRLSIFERLAGSSQEYLGEPIGARLERQHGNGADGNESRWFGAQQDGSTAEASYVNGFWRDADWILRKRWNRDDWEWCPTKPGVFPLASGTPNRVLKLRGYGDAIVPQVAAEFIQSYLEVIST